MVQVKVIRAEGLMAADVTGKENPPTHTHTVILTYDFSLRFPLLIKTIISPGMVSRRLIILHSALC